MSILEFRVEGYRSIRDVRLELNQITVVKGANGVGKSNLYNGLCLLAKAASGEFAASIAADGGMPSILWAGPPKKSASRKEPKRMKLELRLDDFNYQLECGLTPKIPPQTRFDTDPQIKSEFVWYGNKRRKSNTVLERRVGSAWVRDHNETVVQYPAQLIDTESALAQLHEPHLYPELSILREKLRWWRFYHHFSTDSNARLRSPQNGVRTTVLSSDGSDLAAALQTIIEIGDVDELHKTIEEALDGAQLQVEVDKGVFYFYLKRQGIQRSFGARELSDGTLRFLCLVAALLTPRPPELLALNEPETSLHEDLLLPLARLIVNASSYSQIWITTHSEILANAIEDISGQASVALTMNEGETQVVGQPASPSLRSQFSDSLLVR